MRAENLSPHTIETRRTGVEQLIAWLTANGLPLQVSKTTRDNLRDFIVYLQTVKSERTGEVYASGTVHNRFKAVKAFFVWCLAEEEVQRSPMERLAAPKLLEEAPQMISDADFKKLLDVVSGKDTLSRRDHAILMMLYDCGVRRGEIAGLQYEDVDLDHNTISVLGKGRRPRVVPFGRKTARSLDRWIRLRGDEPGPLWLSRGGGALSGDGLYQMVKERAKQAGLEHAYPHLLRHGFAHHWLAAGGQEGDLLRLAGWASRTMLSRYAASAADERARDAHKKFSPGDKL